MKTMLALRIGAVWIALMLLATVSFAQLTDFNVNCPGSCGGFVNPFNCLPNWGSTHGTPRIGSTSFEGSGALTLLTDPDAKLGAWGSEGAFWALGAALDPNECYLVSFHDRASGTFTNANSLVLGLTTGLIASGLPANQVCTEPNASSPTQIFHNRPISDYTSGQWDEWQIVITPAAANLNQLWVRSTVVGSPTGFSEFYVDPLEIELLTNTAGLADFTFTPTGPICADQTVSFCSLLSGDVTHSWTFGDGGVSSLQKPDYVYTTPGTYTVQHTVTSTEGCFVETSSLQITILPTAEALFAVETAGLNCGVFEVCFDNQSTGDIASFNWTFGDGTNDNSNWEPCHTYENPGNYTVTLTVMDACGQQDAFGLPVVITAADLQYDATIGVNMGSVSSINTLQGGGAIPLNSATNETWRVEGILEVDANYTFGPGLTIELGPGAIIRVLDNITLTMDQAHLRGCDYLWRGIQLMSPGTGTPGAVLDIDDSTIEDAEYAIDLFTKATLNAANNQFDQNFVGIHYHDTFTNGGFFMGPFFGNTFTCTENLLPPYPGQTTVPGQLSFAGMEIYNQGTLVLGVNGMPLNKFVGIRNGILVENTSLRVRRCQFDALQNGDGYALEGFGIRSTADDPGISLEQLGMGTAAFPFTNFSFRDCRMGIYAENIRIELIQKNRMVDMGTGVRVNAGNTDVLVNDNRIGASDFGINLEAIDPATLVAVSDNHITMDGFGKTIGISLNQVSVPPVLTGAISIFENEVFLASTNSRGISLNYTTDVLVRENEVTVTGPLLTSGETYRGIHVAGSSGSIICGNYCTGAGDFDIDNLGLYADASPSAAIQCNTLDNWYTGVRIEGPSDSQNGFRGNTMDHYKDGLRVEVGSILGSQGNMSMGLGNKWVQNGPLGFIAARHEDGTQSIVNMSLFFIDNSGPPNLPSPVMVVPPVMVQDFIIVPLGLNNFFQCEGDLCDQSGLEENTELTQAEFAIINEGLYDESYPVGYHQLAYQRLLGKLENNPLLLDSEPGVSAFYNEQSTSNFGAFAHLDQELRAGWAYAEDLHDQILQLNALIQQAGTDLVEMDSAQIASGNPDWPAERQQILLDMEANQLALIDTWQTAWQQRLDVWSGLADQNNAIPVDQEISAQIQWLNALLLETIYLNQTQLPETVIDEVEAIALLCPREGGAATYLARSLMSLVKESPLFYAEYCDLQENRLEYTRSQSAPDFQLSPNPAGTDLKLYFPMAEGKVTLQLTDLLGRVYWRKEVVVEEGQVLIDLSGEVEGLYIVTWLDRAEMPSSKSIVIQH